MRGRRHLLRLIDFLPSFNNCTTDFTVRLFILINLKKQNMINSNSMNHITRIQHVVTGKLTYLV